MAQFSFGNLETLAVGLHFFFMLPARFIALIFIFYAVFFGSLFFRILTFLYGVYFIRNRAVPHLGGNRCDLFRRSWYFRLFADYFPVKLEQQAELPTDKNYLVVFHPHGIWFLASTLVFAADICQLEIRKGLRTFLTTINSNFWLPFAREYLLAAGFISVSENSIKHVLNDEKGGNLVCLLPGGSAEASFAEPQNYRLLLKRRRGFCRVALETGAWLVPTIAFGEIDCFRPIKPTKFYEKFQRLTMQWFGINPVPYKGHKTNRYFAVLPKRTPITVIMGEPIEVTKTKTPTPEDIAALHDKYIDRIRKLFEAEKHKYLENAAMTELVIQ